MMFEEQTGRCAVFPESAGFFAPLLTQFIAGLIGLMMMTYETMPNTGRANGALAGCMQALILAALLSSAATGASTPEVFEPEVTGANRFLLVVFGK